MLDELLPQAERIAVRLKARGETISIAESGNAAQKDYISYWAAGQLLVRHANPYDADVVFRLEKAAGFTEPHPLVMRNPPHALLLSRQVLQAKILQ